MRVTIERVVDDPAVVEEFLELYRSAFSPLDTLAAGRQALTDDEFRAELVEESVLKFVGRDSHDRPVAMAIMATDLSTLPWISPAFWQERYPEQFARNAIFYVGALLVAPEAQGSMWFHRLLRETIIYAAERRGVGAIDVCRYNAQTVDIPRAVAKVSRSLTEVAIEEVDVQTYWAFVYDGLKPGRGSSLVDTRIDTGSPERADIDLRDPTVTGAPRS